MSKDLRFAVGKHQSQLTGQLVSGVSSLWVVMLPWDIRTWRPRCSINTRKLKSSGQLLTRVKA